MTLSVGNAKNPPERVALVTGGGKGTGAAIALRLARAGMRVAVLGRDRLAVERVARETSGLSLEADVTDPPSVDRALMRVRETWGPISVLVQNAGAAGSARLADTSDEDWDRMMMVNATAPFRLARTLLPAMVKLGWGRVVHVASTAGLAGHANSAAFTASKHALIGLTRALAVEFGKSGVTVNALCPGYLEPDITRGSLELVAANGRRPPEETKRAGEDRPEKRLFQVDEVAHAVAMLCADEASGINGQAISICGPEVLR